MQRLPATYHGEHPAPQTRKVFETNAMQRESSSDVLDLDCGECCL